MKNIVAALFICFNYFAYSQINVGNNQTICFGDAAQIIANTSVQGGTDSYQLANIAFAPEPIAGTSISLFDDDVQGPFPIGFAFQFYGNTYTDFFVGSNGWMGFSSGQPTSFSATPIPDSLSSFIPRNCIMLSWEDLNPSSGGQVLYQTIGTAPNRKLILTFDNVPYFGTNTPITSQVVLYEGSNVIDNHITDKPLHNNPSIQGIHDLLGYNATVVPGRNATVWLANNESVRYFPAGISWYDINTGIMVGVGDTLNYSPSQNTFVSAQIIDTAGVVHADTMRLNVLNTQISASGLSLCNGPVILTAASGFALYVWSNNAASPQFPVNTPGTYYVNCTNSNGSVCQSPSITIYADTIPITLGVADSIEICQGDTVSINGPSGYSSYNWSNGATTANINTTAVGDYYLSALDANGCVGASDTTTISIRVLQPNIWSTYATICNNGPVIAFNNVYTDPIYPSYLWGSSSGLTSTFSSMSAQNPGSYWVTVTDQFGCTGTSDTLTIASGNFTFDLLPTDSIFLCNSGSSVTLDAANSMNVSNYQWSTGATTPTITTNSPGIYYCMTTTLSGCYGFSDTVTVSGINPPLSYSGLSLCSGPVSLNTGSYSSYQWSNLASTQSLSVNQAGDYYVFVTDSNGCTAYSDTVSIYTNAFQYNILPSGSTTICSGYTVDLDAGNQFTNHQWNTGATTPTITASTIGQYYASMTDVNGCSGYTDTVDVTNLSVNITTTGYSLCNPSAYPFIDAGSGYYSYNWSTGDTISAINVALPGDYYVTVIDENGCTASSDTITIYLNTFAFNINAIGTDSICQPSGQVTLDATNNYFSYNWSTGAITQQITVNAAGNYTVDVMDMNGCNGTSNPFTVHNVVLTSNITGQISAVENTVENYTVSANATSTYNWNVTGGTLQSGQGTNTVDILWATPGQGSIYVIETDANGCIGDTISLMVTITQQPSNISEQPEDKINIYPNPFTKSTLISLPNTIAGYILSLYDITGQKVLTEESLTSNTYKLERGTLSKGVYFLEIKTNSNKYIKRIVVN